MRTTLLAGVLAAAALALPRLRSAPCSKPGGGRELFNVIRFDFGS